MREAPDEATWGRSPFGHQPRACELDVSHRGCRRWGVCRASAALKQHTILQLSEVKYRLIHIIYNTCVLSLPRFMSDCTAQCKREVATLQMHLPGDPASPLPRRPTPFHRPLLGIGRLTCSEVASATLSPRHARLAPCVAPRPPSRPTAIPCSSSPPCIMAAFVPVAAGVLQQTAASLAPLSRSRPCRPLAAVRMTATAPGGGPVGRRAALAALAAGALGVASANTSPVWAADAGGDWVTTPSGLKYKDGTWRGGGGGGCWGVRVSAGPSRGEAAAAHAIGR